MQREIALAQRDHPRGVGIRGGFDIANIGEALGTQQLLGGVLRRKTNTGIAHQSDSNRLGQPLGCERRRRTEDASCTGERERGQKAAPGLQHRHQTSPSPLAVMPSARV
jgi:hypothetical protein